MGDISDHFSRYEFACKCGCGFDTVDAALINIILEKVHRWAQRTYNARVKIEVSSGNRCPTHNASEGGAPDSQHIYGKAADFKVYYMGEIGGWIQVNPDRVADFIDSTYPNKLGICRYHNRTHADSRDVKARWG